MNVQYISDHKGCTAGVFIPIEEWERIKEEYNLPLDSDGDYDEDGMPLTKEALLADVKQALKEVELYKKGKIQMQTLDDFLNES
ncbi:MAG: hypothetical protein H7319_18525 [Spirosoma sp.]|nr:hypothetical protein [Spirosoma sp.]